MDKGPVLMVGRAGALGRKVVSELLNRDRPVRMLVRDPVKAEGFARRGVELVHGDMMDLPSLIAAIDGADSVITCAAGDTRHSPHDTALTDTPRGEQFSCAFRIFTPWTFASSAESRA
jgi:uncharacterized protein YbjT (DUF2867 family)